jgi:transposase
MAWLGEELSADQQGGATPFSPRCTKDLIEERLFAQRRDLFSNLSMVFFDTTSVYFEGEGGETLGAYGHSKDHRGDRKQMVIGVILDEQGRPICCEMWPGNTTDVKTLIPVVDRLRGKFNIDRICIVADRGMISKETVAALRKSVRNVSYILGVRMRAVKRVRETVLADKKPFKTVYGPRKTSKDPSPLKVKEVMVGKARYIVCHNEEQARKDEADRAAIVESLKDKLKAPDKALVGNKGYRKFLKTSEGKHFELDTDKIASEVLYDGKWVLQTDLDAEPKEVALRYKDLWAVEAFFRSLKSIMENRPIYHKCDETIRGHVFCSFLALVLFQELQLRLVERGWSVEWARLKDDLDALEDVTVECTGQPFTIRSQTRGDAGKALQAAGVALGPAVRAQDKNTRA